MCFHRVVFYANSIVWWQLLGKEAIDWQGTGLSSSAKCSQLQVLCHSDVVAQERAGALDEAG